MSEPSHIDIQTISTESTISYDNGIEASFSARDNEPDLYDITISLGSVIPEHLSLVNLGVQGVNHDVYVKSSEPVVRIAFPENGQGYWKYTNAPCTLTRTNPPASTKSVDENMVCFLETKRLPPNSTVKLVVDTRDRRKASDILWPESLARPLQPARSLTGHTNVPPPFPPASGEN